MSSRLPKMKSRFRRLLFNILGSLSLVLVVALGPLWRRSYRTVDHLAYSRWGTFDSGYSISLSSYNGQLIFGFARLSGIVAHRGSRSSFTPHGQFQHSQVPAAQAKWQPFARSAGRYGFSYFILPRSRGWGGSAPCWAVAAFLAVLPVTASMQFIRSRRRPEAGFCIPCGYNLTGNTSGICPECGAKIST